MARSKVKSRSRHDVAHLHPLTNVPTKYQHPTPYSFRDIAQTTVFILQRVSASFVAILGRKDAYTL